MASVYNIEPQPNAKVILNTTDGDLTLELFGKQTPLATRNFLQHCLDGYYNNTIFHRLVAGFVVQGGDPTGTGSGGISTVNNGEPFQDEFHSRLKFNRRGLLGMANEGRNANTSQFFFTLGPTPELQGKNTMFGRVEGDTIYNLMKMADAEMSGEGSERPLYPTRITGSEIVINPFPDMVVRAREAPRTQAEVKAKDIKKRKKPLGKNIMSFGDEGEEDLPIPLKKAKVNPRIARAAETKQDDVQVVKSVTRKQPQDVRSISSDSDVEEVSTVSKLDKTQPEPSNGHIMDDEDEINARDTARQVALDRTNAEIAALKASMKRTNDTTEKPPEKPRSALEAMIPASSTRGRKRGKLVDESGALDIFNAFKSKLASIPAEDVSESINKDATAVAEAAETAGDDEREEEEAELCDLHFIANCQSCKAWDDEQPEVDVDEDDDTAWMSHKLTFAKDTLGKDLMWRKKMDEIEVIDPREKARAIEEESRKGKTGRRKQ